MRHVDKLHTKRPERLKHLLKSSCKRLRPDSAFGAFDLERPRWHVVWLCLRNKKNDFLNLCPWQVGGLSEVVGSQIWVGAGKGGKTSVFIFRIVDCYVFFVVVVCSD